MQSIERVLGVVFAAESPGRADDKPGMVKYNAASSDDYIGPDGLRYCAACHTRKQVELADPINIGQRRKFPVMCACSAEAARREDEVAAAKEAQRKLGELARASLMTDALRKQTFDRWTGQDENKRLCQRYVTKWPELKLRNKGLLLYGPPGTGKTFAAACIANALLAQGVPVMMTSFLKLMQVLDNRDDDQTMARLDYAHLLVIDDLGAERDTSTAISQVYDILDSRYRAGRPLILTTNLTMAQMKDRADIRRWRIMDRAFENCHPVPFTGTSRRIAEAKKSYEEMRELLGGADQ